MEILKGYMFVSIRILNTLFSMYPLFNFIVLIGSLLLLKNIFSAYITQLLIYKNKLQAGMIIVMSIVLFITLIIVFIPSITINSVSFLFMKGYPLYQSLNSNFYYSLYYGPLYYLFFSLPVLLTSDLYLASFFARFFVLFLFCFDLFLMFIVIGQILPKQDQLNPRVTFFKFTGVFLLFLFFFSLLGAFWGGFEKDILILTLVLLSMIIAESNNKFLNIFMQAIILACLINIKITAGVYFIPTFWIIWKNRKLLKVGISDYLFFILTLFVFSILPFLHPSISLNNYLKLLLPTNGVPNSLASLVHASNYILIFIAMFILIFPISVLKDEKKIYALFFAALLVLPVVIKAGAGGHHLMPLIPYLISIFLLLFFKQTDKRFYNRKIIVMGALIIVLLLNLAKVLIPYGQYLASSQKQKVLIEEMCHYSSENQKKSIIYNLVNYPGHFEDHNFLYLYLISKGFPVFLDYQNLAAFVIPAKIFPSHLISRLEAKDFDIMLFDKGVTPFRYEESLFAVNPKKNSKSKYYKQFQLSFYNHHKIWLATNSLPFKLLVFQKWLTLDYESFLFQREQLFPSKFMDVFKTNYKFVSQTSSFDIYKRKK